MDPQKVIDQALVLYNKKRAVRGEPAVRQLSRQVEALAIILVKEINFELAGKPQKDHG